MAAEDSKVLRRSTRSTRGSVKIEPQDPELEDEVEEKLDEKKPKRGKAKKQPSTKVNQSIPDDDDLHLCYELTEREMKNVNNAFDSNADGEELMGGDDLKTAIRSLGFEPRADEIQRFIKKYANKKGKVNRDGFQRMMAQKMASSPGLNDRTQNNEISKVFNLLDLDRTGMITLENLTSIAKELEEDISEEELREMISEADKDGDSQVNQEEFIEIMKKTGLY